MTTFPWNPSIPSIPLVKLIAPSSTKGEFPILRNDCDASDVLGCLFRDDLSGEVWCLDQFPFLPRPGDSVTFGISGAEIDGAIVDKVKLFGMNWDEEQDIAIAAYIDVVIVPQSIS